MRNYNQKKNKFKLRCNCKKSRLMGLIKRNNLYRKKVYNNNNYIRIIKKRYNKILNNHKNNKLYYNKIKMKK